MERRQRNVIQTMQIISCCAHSVQVALRCQITVVTQLAHAMGNQELANFEKRNSNHVRGLEKYDFWKVQNEVHPI